MTLLPRGGFRLVGLPLAVRRLQVRRDLRLRPDDDAVSVGHNDIAVGDGHAADDDRAAHGADSVLAARNRRNAARPPRPSKWGDSAPSAEEPGGDNGRDPGPAPHRND